MGAPVFLTHFIFMTRNKPKRTHSSPTKKVSKKTHRKIRKSSISRIEKQFKNFDNDIDQYNKYENLALDVSDTEELLQQDRKGHHFSFIEEDVREEVPGTSDVPIGIFDSENQSSTETKIDACPTLLQLNKLANNDDFIPFSASSEDEDEDDEGPLNPTINDYGETLANRYEYTSSVNVHHPWILNHDHTEQRSISAWLTTEIIDFVSYISPSKDEIHTRNRTLARLRKAVSEQWKDASLHVFGSYATDLYLPGSDIDCAVISRNRDKAVSYTHLDVYKRQPLLLAPPYSLFNLPTPTCFLK